MSRSQSTGAWKRANCSLESFYDTPGTEEHPPGSETPSEHQKAVDDYVAAVIAPTRHMHRPMSASIRPKSGTSRSTWPKDVEQMLKDTGDDGCQDTSRLSGVSVSRKGSKTRPSSSYGAAYGHIPRRPSTSKRLRPQTAHSSRTTCLPESRSVQTDAAPLSPPTNLATSAESTGDGDVSEIRNDEDALSKTELEHPSGHYAGQSATEAVHPIKSWTAVFPYHTRPATAPPNQIHSSGSRFFTSTEAFEEFLMTRENKFRNQRLRREEEYRKGLRASRCHIQLDRNPASDTATRPARLRGSLFSRPATASVLQSADQRDISVGELCKDSLINLKGLPDVSNSAGGLRLPVSSKPEFFARVIKVVEQQREERIKNEELRRRRVARKNTHQKTEAEARAKREEEARKQAEIDEKRRLRNEADMEYVRVMAEEEDAKRRRPMQDDGSVSSFLPRADRSHSLAASLGFRTRVF